MSSLRRFAVGLLVVSLPLAGWAGCGGGDDTSTPTDGGNGGQDSTSGDDGGATPSDGSGDDGGHTTGDGATSGGDANDGTQGLPTDDAGHLLMWGGQEAYVKASNTSVCGVYTYCDFGQTVALSADGNTLAAGSPQESSPSQGLDGGQNGQTTNAGQYSGAVYVYRRNGTTWTQEAYIKASNAAAQNNFGASVSLSADGNTLVVGAPKESGIYRGVNADQTQGTNAPDGGGLPRYNSGAAYVFTRTGTSWAQDAYIKASNSVYSIAFGTSVSISGDGSTIVVGAPNERTAGTGVNPQPVDGSTGQESGAIYVYRHGSSWTEEAFIKPFVDNPHLFFGESTSVSYDGSVAVAGAYGDSSLAQGVNGDASPSAYYNTYFGAAFAFHRAGTTWTQDAYLKASDTTLVQAEFGYGVAISGDGNTIGIGAWAANKAYVFTRAGNAWAQQGSPLAIGGTSQYLGYSLAFSYDGNRLVIGDTGDGSGARGVNGDASTSGGGSGAGAAWGLTRSGTTWTFREWVKASNTYAGTLFGSSVAVSNDARTLAVGSKWELSPSSGINGSESNGSTAYGAVYVFH